MKAYTVRVTFTDRRFGPGTGRNVSVSASSLPGAIAKAAREFWKGLDTRQRNDARRGGLKAEALEYHKDI